MAAQPARYHTTSHTDATLRVSRWAAYLHDQRVHTSHQLRDATSATRTAFAQRALASRDADAEARRQRQLADSLGREVFASLYEQAPQLDAPAAGTELVQKAHAMLAELPEAQALAQQVQGDPDLCALATAQLLQGVAGALPAMAEQERQQAQQQAQQALGQRRRQRGPQADPDGALRRALRGAAQQAAQQAADVQAALEGLQPGLGACPAAHDHDSTGRLQLAERVTTDPRLQRVLRLAGRLQREASSQRTARGDNGASCVVGVHLGGDLGRALPTELAAMRPGSRLRMLTLARWADKRLQQYQLQGDEPQGRGPIVVLLDESGSMRGAPSLWAAAVALASLGIAARERRACTVVGFNGGIRYIVRLDAQGRGWRHDVRDHAQATRMGGAADVALHVATSRPSGGTDFDAPLQCALGLEDGVLNERADLLLVTDGHAQASAQVQAQVAQARAEQGLRVFGLTVGGGSLGHAVRQLCDSTVDLDRAIAGDNAGEVADALP
jgi:uncharacterized protein with von Willebrand factor type A (vWA) domain